MQSRVIALATTVLAFASPLTAQDSTGTTVLFQPTGMTLTFGEGATSRRLEQASIPLAMVFPFHRRFSVDLTTAAAYTRIVHGDSTHSEIYGGTDTQLRANIRILMDHLMLTLGVNAPSGQYYIDSTQVEAASTIGNDFLSVPISSMGNGPAGTAGVAAAVRLLGINLGVGGSLRKSMEFVPYGSGSEEIVYQPGDETRLRVSAERRLWLGTASVAMTFMSFGEETANATTYSTGDRTLTTLGWSLPVWKASVDLGLWNLSRESGQQFGGPAPPENIRNLSAAVTLPLRRWMIRPTMDSRRWQIDGDLAGELRSYGIAIGIPVGRQTMLVPSYSATSGTLHSTSDASQADFSGWQASLLLRRR